MANRPRRPLALRIIVWVLVIVLVLLVVAEFALRALISHQVKEEMPGTEITIGGYPLVLSLPGRTVKSLEIEVPDNLVITYPDANSYNPVITGNPAADIVIHDLTINSQDDIRAGELDLHTTLHDDYLLAMVQQSVAESAGDNAAAAKLLQVTGVHTTNKGTIEVEITDGVLGLTLTPLVKNGALSFEAQSTSLLGFSLPDVVSEALSEGLAAAATQQQGNYRFEDVSVAPNAFNVHLTGTDVPLNQSEVPLNGLPQSSRTTPSASAR